MTRKSGGHESGGDSHRAGSITASSERPAAANPAVESLADFIIPKAAVNPAAHPRPKEWEVHPNIEGGTHYTEICECELCERIRELEAELEKTRYELGRQWGRAERAEARVKELDHINTENALAVTKWKRKNEQRIKSLHAETELKALYANGWRTGRWVADLKARAERAEAAARTEATAAQIHFEARQRLEARVKELEGWIWKLAAADIVSAGAIHDHLGIPYRDVMKELSRLRRKAE